MFRRNFSLFNRFLAQSSLLLQQAKIHDPANEPLPLPNDMLGPKKDRTAGSKSTMDEILRHVMNDALAARDRGEKPDMDFVYKNAQEKIYEEEHGEKPPSTKSNHFQHIPFPPREEVRRLTPFTLYDDDPWPVKPGEQLSETPDERGKTKFEPKVADGEEEQQKVVEEQIEDEATKKQKVQDAFLDCSDELAHWEKKYLIFLRDYPLGLRRALPIYADLYKHLTHRLVRAERRYIRARNAVVGAGVASPNFFAATEKRVERCRKVYVETHKSLTQQNYDPTKIRKSFTGKILSMDAAQFEEWMDSDRDERNADFANMQS
jgi:hypothetical protein